MSIIAPYSSLPITSGKIYPDVYVGAVNSRKEEGIGVIGSLDTIAVWSLRYALPSTLPSGTPKFRFFGLSNATAGTAALTVSWACVPQNGVMDTVTLATEETQSVIWSAGNADAYKFVSIVMDATGTTASQNIVAQVSFTTAGWTLASKSVWQAFVVWE